MNQGWQQTPIPGVMRRSLTRHEDARGALREAWRSSWASTLDTPPILQANHTFTRAGALRGLHFHLRQTDIWVVLDGRAHVGLVDIREALGGGLMGEKLDLELASGDCVLIPAGVAHGLWAVSDVSLLYLVSAEYDGTDEHGFAWDDPAAGLDWPAGTPLLSDRDRTAPGLADAVTRARR